MSLGLELDLSELEYVDETVPKLVKKLLDRKFIVCQNDRYYPMRNVAEAFSHPVIGEMTVARALNTPLGLISRRLHVARMPHNLIVMSAFLSSGEMLVDWRAIPTAAFTNYLSHSLEWTLPKFPIGTAAAISSESLTTASTKQPDSSAPVGNALPVQGPAGNAVAQTDAQADAFPMIWAATLLGLAASFGLFCLVSVSSLNVPVFVGLFITLTNLILCGMCTVAMLRMDRQLIRYAAILGCIPVVSPWAVLGMLAGAGIFVSLNRENVGSASEPCPSTTR